ncbi:hypothetical protein ACRRTK_014306 [Alexandromys fortis]
MHPSCIFSSPSHCFHNGAAGTMHTSTTSGTTAQQLTELEKKLAVAKNELEKAALDRESQMKAMKETVQLCLTSVFRDQPPPLNLFPSNPSQTLHPPRTIASKIPDSRTKSEHRTRESPPLPREFKARLLHRGKESRDAVPTAMSAPLEPLVSSLPVSWSFWLKSAAVAGLLLLGSVVCAQAALLGKLSAGTLSHGLF